MVLTVLVGSPVIAAIFAAMAALSTESSAVELACWVMPNARVLLGPVDRGCPLRFDDQIRYVEGGAGEVVPIEDSNDLWELADPGSMLRVATVRDGRLRWLDVAVMRVGPKRATLRLASVVLVAAALMWIPLSLLWRSRAQAALPFGLLHSATCVVVIGMTCGRNSTLLARMSVIALTAAPATVAHLGLTFPRERRVAQDAPGLLAIPYLVAAMALPAGWIALERDALLWPTFMLLLVFIGTGAWLMLIVSCFFALHESRLPLERARARVVCVGSTILPVLPALLLAPEPTGPAEFISAYLWTAAVGMSWPIGLAISRYDLFNLGWDVRRLIGRVVYGCTAAASLTAVLLVVLWLDAYRDSGPEALLVFSLSLGCVVLLDPIRGRVLDLLESVFLARLGEMSRARDAYERKMAELHDEDTVGRLLGELVVEGLGVDWSRVLLFRNGHRRTVHAFGASETAFGDLVEIAEAELEGDGLLHVAARLDGHSSAIARLQRGGVVVVAAIEAAGERLGLLLVGGRKGSTSYTEAELGLLRIAVSHAAVGIRNARLTDGLIAAERQATTGRIALSLAHDLGKELDWLRRLVLRLPSRADDRERLQRDVEMVRDFAEGLVVQVKDFVRETAADANRPDFGSCAEVVESAVRRVERIHGKGRIVQSLEPAVHRSCCHENLGRVVANLLDNALRASDARDSVHLHATLEGTRIRLIVSDRGHGLSESESERAFELGYSTRRRDGGLGVGLAISREMVEALGGEIRLEPGRPQGALATVLVPVAQRDERGTSSGEPA